MANLATLLEHTAVAYPDRVAIVYSDETVTYAQLDASANQVANLLVSRGVQPGDNVTLSCPNVPAFTAMYYGILKTGAAVVPLNVLLKSREVAYHLGDSDAKAYLAFEGNSALPIGQAARDGAAKAGRTEPLIVPAQTGATMPWQGQPSTFATAPVDDDDTAVILYTSGTTGQPKGAELRHRNMRDNAFTGVEMFGCDPGRPDTYLCVLPLFHSFGQTVVQNASVATGGTLLMLPRFEPGAVLTAMAAHHVTFLAFVPTMYWGLLSALDASDVDVEALAQQLRIAVSGGAALPKEIHRQFQQRFGVTILEGYGLSETSPIASFSTPGAPVRVGSIGKPILGVEMKLINEDWSDVQDADDAVGEIAIKGHNVMKGYYGRPEDTGHAIQDGWFRTGDLARRDADGWFYIVDRSKDMIIRGGFNIYPRELEEVLMEHPAVSLVAVIGVPHESHGEEVKAVVVKQEGETTSEDELIAWGKHQFAAYKYPRIVEFVDSLPMTSTGKILKRELS